MKFSLMISNQATRGGFLSRWWKWHERSPSPKPSAGRPRRGARIRPSGRGGQDQAKIGWRRLLARRGLPADLEDLAVDPPGDVMHHLAVLERYLAERLRLLPGLELEQLHLSACRAELRGREWHRATAEPTACVVGRRVVDRRVLFAHLGFDRHAAATAAAGAAAVALERLHEAAAALAPAVVGALA